MAVIRLCQDSYDRSAIKTRLAEGLTCLGGLEAILDGRRKLLLKPNFVTGGPREKPATTHPEFYLAVAELLLDHGCAVTIGDSPAFGSAKSIVAKHAALTDCERLGVDIITIKTPRDCPGAVKTERYERLSIGAEIDQFEGLINLPKLKVHQQFTFTGATKNLYGCVTGKRKAWRHFVSKNDVEMFARMILANAREAAPVLNIGDGIVAMHRVGPIHGVGYPLGDIVISNDFLEHDWLVMRRFGLAPEACPLFRILPPADRDALEAACGAIFEADDWAVAPEFEHAEITPIRFNTMHMVRSVSRSLRAGT